MMPPFTKVAYKSAEKAFKKTTGNKKTMTAVASKGRLGLFLSACLVAAATADDASGPALRGDVLALAPQDPGLFPEDALASDGGAPPDDAKGEEGPPASRRLQVHSEAGGWTKFEGKYQYQHNTLTLDGEGGGDAEYCKALCVSFEWCVNFDVTTVHHASGGTKCFLSNHEADVLTPVGANEQDPRFDFYELDRTQLLPEYIADIQDQVFQRISRKVGVSSFASFLDPDRPGWTKHEGKYLEDHNTLTLDGEGGGDADYCKALCASLPWCVNIDVMTNRPKCFLSGHEAGGDVLATDSRFDHYTLDRARGLGPHANAMQEFCDFYHVWEDETGFPSNDFGDAAHLFLPFCDVSERRDFNTMFSDNNGALQREYGRGWGTSFNADLSQWDVRSGTDFALMFYQMRGFDRDLSRWTIHRHPVRIRNNEWITSVDRMFAQSGMSDLNNCPCIEGDTAGVWRRWCPGLNLPGNPGSHGEAAARDDLDCEPTTSPSRL